MSNDFTGKTVLILGGTSGIGESDLSLDPSTLRVRDCHSPANRNNERGAE